VSAATTRIGLYGGMANNMFVVAKALDAEGFDVCFIRDRTDHFAFSQPVWEESYATLAYDKVLESSSWSWDCWSSWERDIGWQPPHWLFDPLTVSGGRGALVPERWQLLALPTWPAIVESMQGCGALLVCGVEGTFLADMSGRPFIIMPHGGDVRIAARLAHFGERKTWIDRWFGSPQERLLRRAYRRTKAVVTHGPLRLGGPLDGSNRSFKWRLPLTQFAQLSIPVFPRPRLPKSERRRLLNDLLRRLGQASIEAECIAIVPSRVDYYWKGQDRLLPALDAHGARGRRGLHVIFSGWGIDFDKLRQATQGRNATFLPFAMSKQVLYELFQAADFVIDQFVLGHYGTSAQEAMACGAPVMMWCDPSEYEECGWTPPPVINVRSPQEIAYAVGRIVDGHLDLERLSAEAQRWIIDRHGAGAVGRTLSCLLPQVQPGPRQPRPAVAGLVSLAAAADRKHC
jgi:glycosyltransferase involved in cell wall biosynthesis